MALPEIQFNNLNFTAEHWLIRQARPDLNDEGERFILVAPYQRGSVWTDEQRRGRHPRERHRPARVFDVDIDDFGQLVREIVEVSNDLMAERFLR